MLGKSQEPTCFLNAQPRRQIRKTQKISPVRIHDVLIGQAAPSMSSEAVPTGTASPPLLPGAACPTPSPAGGFSTVEAFQASTLFRRASKATAVARPSNQPAPIALPPLLGGVTTTGAALTVKL